MSHIRSVLPVLLLAGLAPFSRGADYGDLVRHVPNDANSIVLIDVEQLSSTLSANSRFSDVARFLPKGVERLVAASKMDFATMDETWHASVVQLTQSPRLPELVSSVGGSIDNIEGKEAAVLPGDTYVVRIADRKIVVGFPAVRQDVVRLLRSTERTGQIHQYLDEAEAFAENGSELIMALDLAGTTSVAEVREILATKEEGLAFELDEAATIIASIRGISFGANVVGDGLVGSVKVDFDRSVSPIAEHARQILLHALEDTGAVIDELYDWKLTLNDKSLRLTGALTESGLLRVLSLVKTPPALQGYEPKLDVDSKPESLIVASTQSYFQSTQTLIRDLKRKKRGAKTMGQLSTWFRRYAEKIDYLPIRNVDTEMLDAGKYVSSLLRGGSGGLTGAAAQGQLRQTNVSSFGYGWNGYRRGQNSSNIRVQQQIKGYYAANLALQKIDEAMADIRYRMTEKLDADF
ncbi:MAG: hypothetical protein AAFU85_29795 [Planctomycetota bacterium]